MIKLEKIPEGYRVFKDDVFLVAVITTKQNYQGKGSKHTLSVEEVDLHVKGAVIKEPLSPESWSIHLTSPHVSFDDFKAITAALPTEA